MIQFSTMAANASEEQGYPDLLILKSQILKPS